ncbi:MAG: DUF2171 domain-containing protein [Thermomicrobiales bacterium]
MSDADTTAWVVREGQEVLGSDGKKIGEVTGSAGSALIVKHGFLFMTKEYYVPVSAIAGIDSGAVHLNVTSDVATSDTWSSLPEGAAIVPNVAADATPAATAAATSGSTDSWTIAEGMAVIGADGERIGEVEDGTDEVLTVRVGRFFSKTIAIMAAQIVDVRGDAVHVSATKNDLGQGVAASETPFTDLQGRVTNAWSGTQADLDASTPAVDFGQPDPELPITPPTGETPYTPPAAPVAATIATTAIAASDAPDETIETPAIAAEVPGLDLSDAGIPAASEGGIVVMPESDATESTSAEASGAADTTALSDAAAIGDSPDPDLAAEAAEVAAQAEEYDDHGYTDLPSDSFEGFEDDGDEPEDGDVLANAAEEASEDADEEYAAPPVELPGDLSSDDSFNLTEPSDVVATEPDTVPSAAPETTTPAIPAAPAFAATTLGATPANEPASTLPLPTPARIRPLQRRRQRRQASSANCVIASPPSSTSRRTRTQPPTRPRPSPRAQPSREPLLSHPGPTRQRRWTSTRRSPTSRSTPRSPMSRRHLSRRRPPRNTTASTPPLRTCPMPTLPRRPPRSLPGAKASSMT